MPNLPFRKAILYHLDWDWPIWNQPYVDMKNMGEIDFYWGIIQDWQNYLGLVYATQWKMQMFLNAHWNKFAMTPLTNEEAIQWFSDRVSDYVNPVTWQTVTKQMQIDNFSSKLW